MVCVPPVARGLPVADALRRGGVPVPRQLLAPVPPPGHLPGDRGRDPVRVDERRRRQLRARGLLPGRRGHPRRHHLDLHQLLGRQLHPRDVPADLARRLRGARPPDGAGQLRRRHHPAPAAVHLPLLRVALRHGGHLRERHGLVRRPDVLVGQQHAAHGRRREHDLRVLGRRLQPRRGVHRGVRQLAQPRVRRPVERPVLLSARLVQRDRAHDLPDGAGRDDQHHRRALQPDGGPG